MIRSAKKIYIIGSVSSGKTTLAKSLSKKLEIKQYELDNVVWKYNKSGDIKRTSEEIEAIFNKIINKDSWIIEDVGRKIFERGLEHSDLIIFLDIPMRIVRIRILKRWIKQRFKFEKTRYKPTIKMLIQMYKWSNEFEKRKAEFIIRLKPYKDKMLIAKDASLID